MARKHVYWLNPATGNSVESVPDAGANFNSAVIGNIQGTSWPELWWRDYFGIAAGEYAATLVWETAYAVSTRRAILRQRQSPVRTPSRVAPVNLRARQTPYIT